MRYFSVCTGVGGFEMGLPPDWECVGFSEVDKWCNAVLRWRFPSIKNYGDIREIDWTKIPDIDMLIGGFPCQDLSMAGKRKGLAGKRSGLFFELTKALRITRSEYFIFENVAGALNSNGGRDFATILVELSSLGYNIWWQILNAKDVGVPQNRERVFIVGHLGKECPSQIFFEPESDRLPNQKRLGKQESGEGLRGEVCSTIDARYGALRNAGETYIATGEKKPSLIHTSFPGETREYKEIAPTISTPSGGGHLPYVIGDFRYDEGFRPRKNGIAPTVNREASRKDGHNLLLKQGAGIRRLTPTEVEKLMSWTPGHTQWGINEKGEMIEISDTNRYRMCGNGVVSKVVEELVKGMFPIEIRTGDVIG